MPHLFENKTKTRDEFKADCIKAMIECFDAYMLKEDGWASVPDWVELACETLAKYGYKPVNPTQFNLFGGFFYPFSVGL